jgi:thiamine-monophosphate kinase
MSSTGLRKQLPMTEDAFLASLIARIPAVSKGLAIPPGDDCAALDLGDGRWWLIAVDQVVGDRHYVQSGPAATPPELAGRKVLARNLSDIAAMGGVPTCCLVAGAFGPTCSAAWLQRFYEGILALAARFEVAMIGGDLALTPTDTVVSLTILGEIAAGKAVRRGGARAGDEFWATGVFGDSLASGHHLTFEPRCAEGAWLAGRGYAHAMMDVSDGLLLDATRMCRASGVSLVLDVGAVPRRTAATTLQGALSDGEDYELIVAVSPEAAPAMARDWPFATPFARLGGFAAGVPGVWDRQGNALGQGGYDHFVRGSGGGA